jgi:hypothetical protein
VAGPIVIAGKLLDLVESGELTPAQACSVLGQLHMDAAGVSLGPARTQRHRRRLARAHGLVLADGALEEVEVDLHDVLDQALDADVWGASG